MKSAITTYLEKNIRYDGRKITDYREITVETGISKSAEGSARVKIGNTEILVGVKMAVEKPYPDTPNQGNLMVNAELTPMSSPDFETGPPGEQAIELARVIDRGIRESEAVDREKLVIEAGEKVWSVMIDIISINDDGNLFDAAGLAALAALQDARFPEYDGEKVDYMKKTNKKLPLTKQPLPITVLKIGKHLVVDPLSTEEELMDARLTITSTEKGQLCSLQKGGKIPLTQQEITHMIDLAVEKATALRGKIK
jgi:exosome complex component RRP42